MPNWAASCQPIRSCNSRQHPVLEPLRLCLDQPIIVLTSKSPSDAPSDQFILRGVPSYIRSDNGLAFIADAVRKWINAMGADTADIEPGSPWENGYVESFNARLRNELLNGEIFYSLKEAQILIEGWRRHYNQIHPHSSLGYPPTSAGNDDPLPPRPSMN